MTQVIERQLSDLELASAKINRGIEAFEAKKAELKDLAESAEGLTITSVDDRAGYRAVDEKRKELKVARVEIQKQGKGMRDGLTEISRGIIAKEKELVAMIEPKEQELKEMQDRIEAEKERIRQEEIAKEEARIQGRIDALAQYGSAIDYSMLKVMPDETFDQYLELAKTNYEKEQAEKAEAERLRLEQEEKERIAREEEQKRIESERKELEELRRQQAEAQRIIDEKNREIEEEKRRIEKDKADIEAARIKEAEDKKREEELRVAREKAAEEARIKALADAREAEEKKAEQLRRKEARRPDKEKLIAFAAKLSTIVDFQVKSDEAKEVLSGVNTMLGKIQSYINERAEAL